MEREKLSKKENEQISPKLWRGNWVLGWKGLPMVDINIEKRNTWIQLGEDFLISRKRPWQSKMEEDGRV